MQSSTLSFKPTKTQSNQSHWTMHTISLQKPKVNIRPTTFPVNRPADFYTSFLAFEAQKATDTV